MRASAPMKCSECGAISRGKMCRFCEAPLTAPATVDDVDVLARRARSTEKKLARAERREELRDELDQIDRAWEEERAGLVYRRRDGTIVEPERKQITLALVIGVALLVFAAASGDSAVPLVGVAFCVAFGLLTWSRVTDFERAQRRWLERRDPIQEELAKLRRSTTRHE